MVLLAGGSDHLGCFPQRAEKPEAPLFPANPQTGSPAAASRVPAYSLYAGLIVSPNRRVPVVLSARSLTQIVPTVVRPNPIPMIHIPFGPNPRHVEPSEAMGFVGCPVYFDPDITRPVHGSCHSPFTRTAVRHTPSKGSGLWIIVQHLLELSLCDFGFHKIRAAVRLEIHCDPYGPGIAPRRNFSLSSNRAVKEASHDTPAASTEFWAWRTSKRFRFTSSAEATCSSMVPDAMSTRCKAGDLAPTR